HTGYLELFDLVVKHILPGMGSFFYFVLHFNCKFALRKKGPEEITTSYLDEYYPGLSATRMNSDEGLSQALEIFLTAVHVLEPEKGPETKNFLSEQLPDIEDEDNFRQKAYNFLEKVVR
ncbi:hypothetical protein VPJ60_09560, partial [Limosilactobacillus fermentum]